MLTLKEIVLLKFAAGFINNSDARRLMNDFREEVWKKALREKISSLDIPLILQEEIIGFIKPIKLDVDYWRRDHNGIFTAKQESCLKFCFKVDGMVDRIKTADALIHSEWLDVQSRFVLACQYWSGWDVLTFFKNLYEAERNRMLHKFSKETKKLTEHEKKIVQWIKHYKGGCISKSQPWGCSSYYYYSDVSLQSRILDNLSEEDCKSFLDAVFGNTNKMHIGRFCLSRMSADHREQLLTRFPSKVLTIYLFWPYHRFFLEAANKVWDSLPEHHFIFLLHIIIYQKIVALWKDFDYVNLLRQFWQRSPDNLKHCVESTDIWEILMEIVKPGFQIEKFLRLSHRPSFSHARFCKCNASSYEDVLIDVIWDQ